MSHFCHPSFRGGIIVKPSACGGSCRADGDGDDDRDGGGTGDGDGSDPSPVVTGPYAQGVLVIHDGNVNHVLFGPHQTVVCDETGESYRADTCQWLIFHQEHYGTGYTYTYRTEEGDWTDCTTGDKKTYLANSVSGQIPPPPASATLYMNMTPKP